MGDAAGERGHGAAAAGLGRHGRQIATGIISVVNIAARWVDDLRQPVRQIVAVRCRVVVRADGPHRRDHVPEIIELLRRRSRFITETRQMADADIAAGSLIIGKGEILGGIAGIGFGGGAFQLVEGTVRFHTARIHALGDVVVFIKCECGRSRIRAGLRYWVVEPVESEAGRVAVEVRLRCHIIEIVVCRRCRVRQRIGDRGGAVERIESRLPLVAVGVGGRSPVLYAVICVACFLRGTARTFKGQHVAENVIGRGEGFLGGPAGILESRRRRLAGGVQRVVDRLPRRVGDVGDALRVVVGVGGRAGIRQRDDIGLAGADIGQGRDLVGGGLDRLGQHPVAIVIREIRLDAVGVGDFRRLAGAVGGVDGRDVAGRIGDGGQGAGSPGVGCLDGNVGARRLRRQQLAGRVIGIGPDTGLAVGRSPGGVGQRVRQQVAGAGIIAVVDGDVGFGDGVRLVDPGRVIADRRRPRDARAVSLGD